MTDPHSTDDGATSNGARDGSDTGTGGDHDGAVSRTAGHRRWTIRLRTTVLATVIFVVFGVAMALVARSAVIRLVTAQREAMAESALGQLLSSVDSPAALAAIESDPSVRVVYTDRQGQVVSSGDFVRFLGGTDQPEDGIVPPVDEGAPNNTIVVSAGGIASDGPVFDSAGAVATDGWTEGWTGQISFSEGVDGVTAQYEIVDGDSAMIVAVTAPNIGDALSIFDRTMIVLIAALACVVAAMSWFSVAFALRPVEAIRRQVARTDPSDLSHHVPRPETGDEIDRLAVTMNDLLDRLHQASIEQKRFVSDASHELRSPVTAALATIQTVDRSRMGPGWSEVEPTLTDATVRLSTLIEDLFLMSTLDERQAGPDGFDTVAETDLDEVALRVAERPHRCTVAVRVDRPVRVLADERLIDRCVTNLVDNATRYARDSVLVSVGVTDDGLPELVVTDDGPGIPTDDRDLIFERFARLDASRSGDGGGAGLGLSIARQIAEAHGAELTLDPSESGGASFHLTFLQPVDQA